MIEDFYCFGRTNYPQGFYNNRKDFKVAEVLKERLSLYNAVAFYSNQYIPEALPNRLQLPYYNSVYPKHKAKIQPEHRQAIECHCGYQIPIYRHIPLINDLRLSRYYSTYHPQGLQLCACGDLGVLVDHRGLVRLYTNKEFKLVNVFQGYEVKHQDFTYGDITDQLLNFRYRIPKQSESLCELKMFKVNALHLTGVQKLNAYNISCPAIPIVGINKDTKLFHEHFIRYSYTYSIAIFTQHLIYLPNGIAINRDLAFVKELLDTQVSCRMPRHARKKNYRSLLAHPDNIETATATNEAVRDIVEKIIEHYDLPRVQLKEYPGHTIGYMPFLSDTNNWPLYYHRKYYTSKHIHNVLKKLRRTTSRIIRQTLLTDIMSTAGFVRDNFQYTQLQIPPVESYIKTMWLNPYHNQLELQTKVR